MLSATPLERTRTLTVLGIFPAAGLLAAAVLGFVASFVSFEAMRGYLDRAARAGALHEYTKALHDNLTGKLRLAASASLLLGLLAWRFRGRLSRLLVELAVRLRDEFCEALRSLRPAPVQLGTLTALLALVGLAAGLRFAFLGQPMRYDEAFTYAEYASRPVYVLVSKYDFPNNHIFHSLCVHTVCRLLGDAPWAVRLPAFLAGLLLVPAVYAAARALFDRPTALLSAALVAGSSALIEYSTNARGYTLVALCFLLLIRLGSSLLQRPNLLGWSLFTLLAAVGLWTVPTMLFAYGTIVLWLAFSSLRGGETCASYDRSFLAWLAGSCVLTAALTALLYSPVLLVSGVGALTANPFVSGADKASWGVRVADMLRATWGQWNRDMPGLLSAALAAGFLFIALGGVRPVLRAVSLAWITVLWCAGVVMAQRVVPYERVWLFALPLYLILAAAGLMGMIRLCHAPRLRAVLAYTTAAVTAGVLAWQVLACRQVEQSVETGTLREAAELTVFFKDHLNPQDRILAWCPSDRPLEYYFRRCGLSTHHIVASVAWKQDEPHWQGERLLAVVNQAHGQTLAAMAKRYRLAEVGDPSAARLVWQGEAAAVYEIPVLEERQASAHRPRP
jgi:hypothetical protein